MEELVQLIAKTYGIAGLIMISPFVMLGYVWRNNAKLQADISKVHEQRNAIQEQRNADVSRVQEARVNDAKQISEKMMELMEEQAGLNKETSIALDQVRELLTKITAPPKRL